MHSPDGFSGFLGNERIVEILNRTVAQDRLPHALIFSGPTGVGKRTLAVLLALRLNCHSPGKGNPCGACPSCRKILAGMHPDIRIVQPVGAFIRIEQVRSLIGEIAYQPFEGHMRFVILDGADQMRKETANCLLKTLEEPPSRTVMVLVTAYPYLLLETIRSRSQILVFGRIPRDAIARYLVERENRTPEDARLAASFSDGSLGAALALDITHFRAVRQQALLFVKLLLKGGSFEEVSPLAAELAKNREGFPLWLDAVDLPLQDVSYARVAPYRVGQEDLAELLSDLAESVSGPRVTASLDSVKKLRGALWFNVNRQVALESLFLQIQAVDPQAGP